MAHRIILGGPCNSGKSTFALSLVNALHAVGVSAESIELDVWSNSYPAFKGEIPFEGRPKRMGLDWDWTTAMDERLAQFRGATSQVVIGDLAGKLDEAVDYVCANGDAHGAFVVSKTTEGLEKWHEHFTALKLPILGTFITFEKLSPIVVTGLCRSIDGTRPPIASLAEEIRSRLTHTP